MKRHTLIKATTVMTLFILAGCANNDPLINKESTATTITTTAKTTPEIPKKSRNITNAIVAVVNDEIITLHDINKEAKPAINDAEKKNALNDTSRQQIRRTALDRLIEKKLAEQKIKELNIKVSEEEIRQAIDDIRRQNNIPSQEALVSALAVQGLSFDQYRAQLQEQIERLKLVSVEVRAKIQVGESEAREYYAANITKYTDEESYRARHIFFKVNEKTPPKEMLRTQSTALAVLLDAKEGKDFIELAKKFSEDPAARKDGGDLGTFKKGDMQAELEKAIIALKPGEVSDLVVTPIGIHIIKLEAKIAGITKPFESVKTDIDEILYRKKSEERFSQWAKELRSKASVEIRELSGLL